MRFLNFVATGLKELWRPLAAKVSFSQSPGGILVTLSQSLKSYIALGSSQYGYLCWVALLVATATESQPQCSIGAKLLLVLLGKKHTVPLSLYLCLSVYFNLHIYIYILEFPVATLPHF